MSYSRKHYLTTFGGTAPDGEIWQTGVRWEIDPNVGDEFQGWSAINVADIAADFASLVTNLSASWPEDVFYSWAKLAAIKTDGTYDREAKVYELPTPMAGAGSLLFPLQSSWCVSLRSGSTLGLANYGRMYLPALAFPRVTGTGGMAANSATTALGHVKTMLQAVDGEVSTTGADAYLAIFSKKGSGLIKHVHSLKWGLVCDTQRRRRGALAENYVTTSW